MKLDHAVDLQHAKIGLNHGSGQIPALGCGTLIPDRAETRRAAQVALEAGFRHFDCAERYQNEREVGEGLRAGIAAKGLSREDLFITTKLWNTNHRPERVQPACRASMEKLGVNYLDLYLIHTPFAFKPGDDPDPRDEKGNVIYDKGVTLPETWKAMEALVDQGDCRAIGLSDCGVKDVLGVFESARIKPSVVQVECHPYHPQTELLEFCNERDIVLLAFAPLGHGTRPGPLEDPVILEIARRVNQSPAQVLLAWAVQRGTAVLTTPKTPARAQENFNISALPEDAFEEINHIETRQRLNTVDSTGVPGFIPGSNEPKRECRGKIPATRTRRVSMNSLNIKEAEIETAGEQKIRAVLNLHWNASAKGDLQTEHDIYQDDAICDYPQSGERIHGRGNLQALRTNHPAKPSGFTVLRLLGSGNLWVTEYLIRYTTGPIHVVSIMEFQGEKVVHETQYFAEPFEAPAWRSQWVELETK